MGKMIELTAADGVQISAYVAEPAGKPKGAIVVIQEIFGVNGHIRSVADRYSGEGYLAIAPALFDRAEKNVQLDYSAESMTAGRGFLSQIEPAKTMLDIDAAIKYGAAAGPVGVVGYCWGGSLAFAAAVHLPGVAAAVGYYGSGIAARASEQPKAPVMLHFGEKDAHIPLSDVEKIRTHHPEMPIFTYDSGHGFNCEARGSYDKPSADLALSRSLAHLAKYMV